MPKRKLAWASWNYLTKLDDEKQSQSMCLTYWMNRLQPYIKEKEFGNVFVTLNPLSEPDPETVLGSWNYTHPLYSPQVSATKFNIFMINNLFGGLGWILLDYSRAG
jgi:predicted NAD/FAD-binding protein